MKNNAVVIALVLCGINSPLWANDIFTYSQTNRFKSFKMQTPLENTPPLTQLSVSKVYSIAIPSEESISSGQAATKKHHQGP